MHQSFFFAQHADSHFLLHFIDVQALVFFFFWKFRFSFWLLEMCLCPFLSHHHMHGVSGNGKPFSKDKGVKDYNGVLRLRYPQKRKIFPHSCLVF